MLVARDVTLAANDQRAPSMAKRKPAEAYPALEGDWRPRYVAEKPDGAAAGVVAKFGVGLPPEALSALEGYARLISEGDETGILALHDLLLDCGLTPENELVKAALATFARAVVKKTLEQPAGKAYASRRSNRRTSIKRRADLAGAAASAVGLTDDYGANLALVADYLAHRPRRVH